MSQPAFRHEVLAWVLVGRHGIVGAALAKLILSIADLVVLHVFALRLTGTDLATFARRVVAPLLPTAQVCCILAAGPLAVVLTLPVALWLALRFGLSARERADIVLAARSWLRSRRGGPRVKSADRPLEAS